MNALSLSQQKGASLLDTLPLSAEHPRCVLVTDTLESDARFVLYSFVAKVLQRGQAWKVLWLSCEPTTERLIINGLKKIGCSLAHHYFQDKQQTTSNGAGGGNTNSQLTIECLLHDYRHQIDTEHGLDPEAFVRFLLKTIEKWCEGESTDATARCWIVVDNVSAIASLVGERLAYALVYSVTCYAKKNAIGFLFRCSQEINARMKKSPTDTLASDKQRLGEALKWEDSLVDLADGVIDAVPLTSGYSREAHGRITWTDIPGGQGWHDSLQKSTSSSGVVNYCITDAGVHAVRIQGKQPKR
jgi:hypothetical protein